MDDKYTYFTHKYVHEKTENYKEHRTRNLAISSPMC